MRKLSESATLWAVLTRPTELLLRLACVCALLFFGWSLASQTVVQLLVQNQQLSACQAQLKAAPQ